MLALVLARSCVRALFRPELKPTLEITRNAISTVHHKHSVYINQWSTFSWNFIAVLLPHDAYGHRGLCWGKMPIASLSACLCVTRRYCVRTAKHTIKLSNFLIIWQLRHFSCFTSEIAAYFLVLRAWAEFITGKGGNVPHDGKRTVY